MPTMARWFIGTLLLVAGVGATDRLAACGDKYLNLGLGTHYHRSAAERRAAAILVYASAGSELSKLLTTLSVEEAMKKVGYQPAIASSSVDLDAGADQTDEGPAETGREDLRHRHQYAFQEPGVRRRRG
jgi:hypothetical protein